MTAGSFRPLKLDFSDTGQVFENSGVFYNPVWEAEAEMDFSRGPLQSLHVVLENELVVRVLGSAADMAINKAWAQLRVETAVIPVPPAMLLFGSALVFMAGVGHRRKRPVA